MQYTHKNPFSLPAMASALALLLLVEEEKMEVCSPQRPDVMPHAKELFGSKFVQIPISSGDKWLP